MGENIEVLPQGLARQVDETFRSIVGSIPNLLLDDIVELLAGRNDIAEQELAEIARMVVAYRAGEVTLPTPLDFLNARRDEERQLEHARTTLRGILAQSILREGTLHQSTQGLKARIGRATNELTFFLGQRNGKQIVVEALSELSVTERTLLFKSMSTNLKKNLDFPDLEECDELQMADYIATVVYERQTRTPQGLKMTSESRTQLVEIFGVVTERAGTNFSLRKVLESLLERNTAENIFSHMIEASEIESTLDLLENFFLHHEETKHLARECRLKRDGEIGFFDYDE